MERGWAHCKLYKRNMPRHIVAFLKELGNETNQANTVTTILEKLRAIDELDDAWDDLRNKNKSWTWKSLGASEFRNKRFIFVEVGRGR
eukprot:5781509-Pyramimonas_sp.AAC.2